MTAYPDITEQFEGGSVGTAISTSTTAFPHVDVSEGGAVMASGGATGQCAAPGAGTFPGCNMFDVDQAADTTHTVSAVDWTARCKFKITDTFVGSDTGYGLIDAVVAPVGATPQNFNTGPFQVVSSYYDMGNKRMRLQTLTGFSAYLDVSGLLGTWIDVVFVGTSGQIVATIYDHTGAALLTQTDTTYTPGYYRARVQTNTYLDTTEGAGWSVDDFYAGATANDPFAGGGGGGGGGGGDTPLPIVLA